jgi:hypothetical protein
VCRWCRPRVARWWHIGSCNQAILRPGHPPAAASICGGEVAQHVLYPLSTCRPPKGGSSGTDTNGLADEKCGIDGLSKIQCRPVPETSDRFLSDRRRGMGVVWTAEAAGRPHGRNTISRCMRRKTKDGECVVQQSLWSTSASSCVVPHRCNAEREYIQRGWLSCVDCFPARMQ